MNAPRLATEQELVEEFSVSRITGGRARRSSARSIALTLQLADRIDAALQPDPSTKTPPRLPGAAFLVRLIQALVDSINRGSVSADAHQRDAT